MLISIDAAAYISLFLNLLNLNVETDEILIFLFYKNRVNDILQKSSLGNMIPQTYFMFWGRKITLISSARFFLFFFFYCILRASANFQKTTY